MTVFTTANSSFSQSNSFIWDISRSRVVILYRLFGTTYRAHLHGSRVRAMPWRWDRYVVPKRRQTIPLEYGPDTLSRNVGKQPSKDGTDTLSRNVGKQFPLKMGPIRCPETSVNNPVKMGPIRCPETSVKNSPWRWARYVVPNRR
jgi:hypothetical protein